MSTLKKNKRIKLAKQLALYGDVKPTLGNQLTRRGKAKYLGGNGRKTTGISRRAFKMNLQKVRVIEDGQIVRRRVPVSLLRSGVILKPVVRAPFTLDIPKPAPKAEKPADKKTTEKKKSDKKVEAKAPEKATATKAPATKAPAKGKK